MFLKICLYILEKFKNNYKTLLVGILLTPLFFYVIGAVFGIELKDHLRFLIEKSYEAERILLVSQLEEFNKMIDEYEIESYKKQKDIWSIMANELTGEDYKKALGIVNRNHDIIRTLLEFGKIYTSLVKANAHSGDTHENLSEMYESMLYILIHDQRSLCKAFDKLDRVNKQIRDFPESIRDDVQIEVLRYLSYCSATLNKPYDQIAFYQQALRIKERQSPFAMDYRRKFFWLDLCRLVFFVNNTRFKEADDVFKELRDNLMDARFLKARLLQHEDLIREDVKGIWEDYIHWLE